MLIAFVTNEIEQETVPTMAGTHRSIYLGLRGWVRNLLMSGIAFAMVAAAWGIPAQPWKSELATSSPSHSARSAHAPTTVKHRTIALTMVVR